MLPNHSSSIIQIQPEFIQPELPTRSGALSNWASAHILGTAMPGTGTRTVSVSERVALKRRHHRDVTNVKRRGAVADKVTIETLHQMKRDHQRIVAAVVYESQMAQMMDRAGAEVLSVG